MTEVAQPETAQPEHTEFVPPPGAASPGYRIRATHPDAFRSGQWAVVVSVGTYGAHRIPAPPQVYVVRFPDGALDLWPVENPVAGYESATTVNLREGDLPWREMLAMVQRSAAEAQHWHARHVRSRQVGEIYREALEEAAHLRDAAFRKVFGD